MGIDYHFTNCFYRKFIAFPTHQTIYRCSKSDISQNKINRALYLLVYWSGIFPFIKENRSIRSLEYSTLCL